MCTWWPFYRTKSRSDGVPIRGLYGFMIDIEESTTNITNEQCWEIGFANGWILIPMICAPFSLAIPALPCIKTSISAITRHPQTFYKNTALNLSQWIPYVGFTFPTGILCRGVQCFVTDCCCSVWCRGLTTYPCLSQMINKLVCKVNVMENSLSLSCKYIYWWYLWVYINIQYFTSFHLYFHPFKYI